ncbi:DnaA ATPase domain-containing protein [Parafrankia sp. BMG5.11]|uniref:DnaA ATPase domain-containing protein n=1 Tax=Parafrankia sp. BMG5.11 TaxID=222540 RepID=UPI00103CEDD9|nr:DnaA/Hda family protein [Parafrankia sp. BMG5.11]TCJ39377.1 ATPase [Parafrankia sp. BMG5.11]
MGQIALPLMTRRADDPVRIVIGNANQTVIDALSEPAAWPFLVAILAGQPRSGKSLLARWAEGQGGIEVCDDADAADETELFHRWNRAQESGRPLLLVTSRDPWPVTLPDLRSRLGAALHLTIGFPDDEMVAALIQTHAAARSLVVSEGALTYLVPRVERTFAGIEAIVATVDRLSLERMVPPTLSVWRDALEAVQGAEQPRLL